MGLPPSLPPYHIYLTINPQDGEDYRLLTTRVTFSEDTESQIVQIEIIDDDLISEQPEQLTICLPTDFDAAPILITKQDPDCVILEIIDDDSECFYKDSNGRQIKITSERWSVLKPITQTAS